MSAQPPPPPPSAHPSPGTETAPAPALAPARFLTLPQVAEELAVSIAQVRALVRDRSLVGIQIGGRGQWRVERVRLEEYIEGLYAAAARDPREVDAELADGAADDAGLGR